MALPEALSSDSITRAFGQNLCNQDGSNITLSAVVKGI